MRFTAKRGATMNKAKKKAVPLPTETADKTNGDYTTTAFVTSATPHKEVPSEPCGRHEPSTSMLVDLFNPERWCELARLATLRYQVAEPAQQPFEAGTHYSFDYIVGLSSVSALEASDCAAEPCAHDVFDGGDSVGHSGGGEALTTQVEGDGRVSP